MRSKDPVMATRSAPPKPAVAVATGVIKNDQHDRLIEEFRKVHRKMFKNVVPGGVETR